jgi:hypothetical protein
MNIGSESVFVTRATLRFNANTAFSIRDGFYVIDPGQSIEIPSTSKPVNICDFFPQGFNVRFRVRARTFEGVSCNPDPNPGSESYAFSIPAMEAPEGQQKEAHQSVSPTSMPTESAPIPTPSQTEAPTRIPTYMIESTLTEESPPAIPTAFTTERPTTAPSISASNSPTFSVVSLTLTPTKPDPNASINPDATKVKGNPYAN